MATQLTRAAIDDALTTLLSAVGATGAGTVTYSAKGWGSVIFNVTGSSPVGTVTFQGTVDGTNWVSLEAFNVSTATFATTTTVVGVFYAPCAGFELVRANVTAFTSGTWTVTVRGNPTADTAGIAGTSTVAGTVTANQGTAGAGAWPVKGAGTAGTADTGVVTVQGIASGTAQPVSMAAPVSGATNTKSSVNGAAASTTILALNAGRRGAVFYNDSAAILYLDLSGGTATTSSYSVQVASQGYFELPVPIYTGLITGIWSSATGSVKVTELAA